jgi:hypothetical protein
MRMRVVAATYIEGSEILSLLGDINDGSAAGSLVCHDDRMDE